MREKIKSFFGFGSPESTPKSKIITDLTADPNPKPLQLPNPDGTFDNDPTKFSTGKKTTIVPGFTPKASAVSVETDKLKTSQIPDSTPKSEVKKDLKLEDLFKENKGGNAKESKENVSKGSFHPEKQNSRESSSSISEKKTPEKNENKSDKKPETRKESKPFWTPERKKKWKENFQKFTKNLGVIAYGFGKWGLVGAGITAGVLIPASLFVAGVSMPLATSIVTANGVLMGSAGAIKEYVDHKKKEKQSKGGDLRREGNLKKGPVKNESKKTVWETIKKPFDDAAQTIRGWFAPKKK